MRFQGVVKVWKDDRGFGFIGPCGGGDDVFLHVRVVQSERRPAVGDVVTYEVATDDRGRCRADRVAFLGDEAQQVPVFRASTWPWVLGFLAAVSIAVATHLLPAVLALVYLVMSLLTFRAYYKDKAAAQRNEWRCPESELHLLALLCGWPGALIAQWTLRHKNRKQSFQFVFWLTAGANIALLLVAAYQASG